METSSVLQGDPLKENMDTEQNAEHISMFLRIASEHSAPFAKPDGSLLCSQQPQK